jgi:hypothetical protein
MILWDKNDGWDKNEWLYQGQHGFRPGYCCESQVITVCQECLVEVVGIDVIIIESSTALDLVPHVHNGSDYEGNYPRKSK